MSTILGLRGTGIYNSSGVEQTGKAFAEAALRPKDWLEYVLRVYPNGKAPLTAMLSAMKQKDVEDPEFYWWADTLPTMRATITGTYTTNTEGSLSNAYVSGGVVGDTVYVKMSAADAALFKINDQVLFREAADYRTDVNGVVTAAPVINGSNSFLTVKLLEADDNGSSKYIADCTILLGLGTVYAEGAARGTSIRFEPTKIYNFTQIFREPLEMTRTAMKTKFRAKQDYAMEKEKALERHTIGMEKSLFWGVKSERTDPTNGQPVRTTQGIISAIRQFAPDNCSAYHLSADANYDGKTWIQAGKKWLEERLEVIFRYGDPSKIAYCGSGAVLGINELAAAYGSIKLVPGEAQFGIKVLEWITPFGTLLLKTHPLFSYESTTRNSIVVVEPQNLEARFIDKTKFRKNATDANQSGEIDGVKEEWLTEVGLMFGYPLGSGILDGVGLDNAA